MARTSIAQVSILPDKTEFTLDQDENQDLFDSFMELLETRDVLILASTVSDDVEAIKEVFKFRLSEFRDQLLSWSNVQL